ncbi:MAG: hypothetical protein IJ602_04925 [Paludibacteraceae bacterium]|nr:hypothetical protein [Paludibacteraceae bacterium]
MKKEFLFIALAALALAGCQSEGNNKPETDMPEWYYTGGKLGTTTTTSSMAFRQPTPATDDAGLGTMFAQGDNIAEKDFVTNASGRQHGLGPVYVRASCQHCHPNYSHGTSVPTGTYNAKDQGNGTLLVVINPATQAYVPWLAGMPQLFGARPFKAPLDPDQITVQWLTANDEHGNTFPDGETYELRYPEVTMPNTAVYVYNQGYRDPDGLLESQGYKVLLENTIGVYGTGLLDAIPDQDIIDQYAKEAADGKLKNGLNPAMWDGSGIAQGGYYKNDPQWGPKRFTYALSRGPLMDAAGANAIWNITNVTRSDRKYHYLDLNGTIYAEYASKDKEVQEGFAEYIAQIDPNNEHPEWRTEDMEANIKEFLTSKTLPAEMSDDEFTQVMVWHRGLAVPAARNVTDKQVLRGKELFSQIGCDYCHRPSWTTGPDEVRDPNNFPVTAQMPRYPNQKIWPYTDMVQHKLHMENDIRTGWCRTTPLWGRGLHRQATGDIYEARMHDTRARNVIEAIMWHGYSKESDAYYPTQQFYNLPKEDRDAIVAFIDAI